MFCSGKLACSMPGDARTNVYIQLGSTVVVKSYKTVRNEVCLLFAKDGEIKIKLNVKSGKV